MHSLSYDLHDAVATNALREILVVGPDADFLNAGIFGGEMGGGGEPVISFELDHRPDRDAHRAERVLEWEKLRIQVWLDSFACLVVRPELVAE